VATVTLDGRAVLLDEESGELVELDEVATLLWSCFDGRSTIAALASDLSVAADAGRSQIGRDIVEFCKDLACSGVLDGVSVDEPEVVGDGPAPDPGVAIDEIDLTLVPRPGQDVATREVAGQVLLLDAASGSICALDPVGSVVWRCFDGEADLARLVDDLAEVFVAPTEVVAQDVLDLTRDLAWRGLLAGIAAPDFPPGGRPGLEIGAACELGPLTDLDGRPADPLLVSRGSVLLVNWSPTCGYCVGITADLARLRPLLERNGTRLVLVVDHQARSGPELLEPSTQTGAVLVVATDVPGGPFDGVGTPVAYLLEDGRATSPRVEGSGEVMDLARRLAGSAGPASRPDQAPYPQPRSAGMCHGSGGRRPPPVWADLLTFGAGGYVVGVRADTRLSATLLQRGLGARLIERDPDVPANYSVVLGDPFDAGQRELRLLLEGDEVVVRSRSVRRVLLALSAHLSALGDGTDPADDGLVRTHNLAIVSDGEAIVLPPGLAGARDRLQPRLARLGFRWLDQPVTVIDPGRAELVVADPAVGVDPAVLAVLAEARPGRSELAPVETGRYRLRAWTTLFDDDGPAPTVPASLAAALHTVEVRPEALDETLDLLVDLFERVPLVALRESTADQLVGQLVEQIGIGPHQAAD
jgi:hypothetical protein